MGIEKLKGKTITKIEGGKGSLELKFECSDGSKYKMYHNQDCCENVYVEDIDNSLDYLIGSPIVDAYESTNIPEKTDGDDYYNPETELWTFYTLTSQLGGTVVIRWYGSSNGYYGVSVSFEEE